MSVRKKLFFPITGLLIYMTLLAAFLLHEQSPPAGQMLPVALGLLAFSLAITEVFIALRPKRPERKIGLPLMYAVHGAIAMVLILAAIAHAGSELSARKNFDVRPSAAPAGIVAMALLILTALTGALILSNTLIKKSPMLKRLKEKAFKREAGLAAHRLSVLAVVVIFLHMMSVDFVRSNTYLSLLAGIYTALAAGGYIGSKVRKNLLPKYTLQECVQNTPGVYELEFVPQRGTIMPYQPGQYMFVQFDQSALPKESHPFSITSSPDAGSSALQVMIKNSGDYTSRIGELKTGDIARLEGPYGCFMDQITADADTPIVMLAGGIGITPILSILRSQLGKKGPRTIALVWGLASREDLLLLNELQQMAQENADFSFHITFSKERVESFDHGRITQEYLQSIGADTFYHQADYFICGPDDMMGSMKKILRDNQVPLNRIHMEEFSF